jgi:hypothetical protein
MTGAAIEYIAVIGSVLGLVLIVAPVVQGEIRVWLGSRRQRRAAAVRAERAARSTSPASWVEVIEERADADDERPWLTCDCEDCLEMRAADDLMAVADALPQRVPGASLREPLPEVEVRERAVDLVTECIRVARRAAEKGER